MYLKKTTEKQASSGLKWVLCGSFWITIIWPCTVDGDSSRTEQRCCDSSVSFFSSSPWGCCIFFCHFLYCAVRSFLMCLFFFLNDIRAAEGCTDAQTPRQQNRTFTAQAARSLPAGFVPAGSHRRDEAMQETHHVLGGTQRCGVLLRNTNTWDQDNRSKVVWATEAACLYPSVAGVLLQKLPELIEENVPGSLPLQNENRYQCVLTVK